MSDEFDKEAEREKLREKLADDDEKRENTQRMSELLLKGATMTNRHCDDCGDPIFRQDDREFCPTCHTVDAADVQEAGTADVTAGEAAEPAQSPESSHQTETPQSNRSPETPQPNPPTEPPESTRPTSAEVNGSASSAARTPNEAGGSRGAVGAADAFDPSESPANATSPPTGDRAGDTPAGGVDDARASLVRTLTRFARAAEATDDPRRARDNLQAAREAAEALTALDR